MKEIAFWYLINGTKAIEICKKLAGNKILVISFILMSSFSWSVISGQNCSDKVDVFKGSTTKVVDIKEVSVKADLMNKLYSKNIIVLKNDEIQKIATENFINVLDQLPGIVKIHDTAFPLVIRGMYGARIHVEKNGIIKSGIDDNGYTLEDINPDVVRNVRLIHGARSVLFGSGSMGGVLLINEGISLNKIGLKCNAKSSYSTNNSEFSEAVKLGHYSENNKYTFAAKITNAGNYHYCQETIVGNSGYSSKNLAASYLHQFKNNASLQIKSDFYSGNREKPLGFQNNPYDYRKFCDKYNVESASKYTNVIDDNNSYTVKVWYNRLNTNQIENELNAGTKQLSIQEIWYNYQETGGFGVQFLKKESDNFHITTGIDGYCNALDKDWEVTDYAHGTHNVNNDYTGEKQGLGGAFCLTEIDKGIDNIGICLRSDIGYLKKDTIHSKTYSCVTGGIDYTHPINASNSYTISFSRHFRFPEPKEAVGKTFGGRGTFTGNPDIEPETSYNLELVSQGKRKHFSYSMNLWGMFFFNRISEQETASYKYTYVNIDKSRLLGIDCTFTYKINNVFTKGTLKSSIVSSYSMGDDVSDSGFLSEGDPLESIPPGRTRFNLDYCYPLLNSSIEIFYTNTWVAPYNRLPSYTIYRSWGQKAQSGYSLSDVGTNINFRIYKKDCECMIICRNVLDKTYNPFGSYLYGVGRDVKVRFTINI